MRQINCGAGMGPGGFDHNRPVLTAGLLLGQPAVYSIPQIMNLIFPRKIHNFLYCFLPSSSWFIAGQVETVLSDIYWVSRWGRKVKTPNMYVPGYQVE